ncbi:MAG: hypothetical protein LM580_08420 [Thermofilum sp.]|nr:hypothetical protein [Thermofilum sp.]
MTSAACVRSGRLGRDLAELLFALARRGYAAEARFITLLTVLETALRPLPLPGFLLRMFRLFIVRLGLNRVLWVEICAERWR